MFYSVMDKILLH